MKDKSKDSAQTIKPVSAGMSTRTKIIAVAVFMVLGLRLVRPIIEQSPTFDEGLKMAAAHAFATARYPYYDFQNPPLAKLVFAVPLLLLGATAPLPDEYQRIGASPFFKHPFSSGYRFLFRNKVPVKQLLFSSRALSFFFYLLGGLLLFFFLNTIAPPAVSILGGLLYFTCPNLAAAGATGNNDSLMVVCIVLFLWAVIAFIEKPSLKNNVVSAAALGLALMVKYSLMVFVPYYAVILAIMAWRRIITPRNAFRSALLAGGIVLFIVEAAYLFMTPQAVISIFKAIAADVAQGRMTYVMGRFSSDGFLYFHPLAFLLKTPVPVILFIAVSVIVFFYKKKYRDIRLLAVSAALFLFAVEALFSKYNLGFRYFLPFYPMAYIFAPLVFADRELLVKRSIPFMAALLVPSVLLTHPRYQSYFNCLIGRGENACHYFVDSTLDWGQDLGALADYLKKEGNPELILSYFGTCDPSYYGLTYQNLASDGLDVSEEESLNAHVNSDSPKKEYLAVSATCLVGLDYPDHAWFSFLKDYKPVKTIGNTIFVYDATDRPDMYKNMAKIYAATDSAPQLLRCGRRVHVLSPADGFGRLCAEISRAQAAAEAGKSGASFDIDRTMFADIKDREILTGAAMSYVNFLVKSAKYPAALRQLDTLASLKWEGLDRTINNVRGVVYLRSGDLARAGKILRQSISDEPGNASACYNLGIVYERKNDPAAAAEMYRQALAANPEYLPARQRLERISPLARK